MLKNKKKIALSISSLDIKIEDKLIKIKSLIRLKKSLMQNLLTGKVRVDVLKLEKV
jgi:hypothetical protein